MIAPTIEQLAAAIAPGAAIERGDGQAAIEADARRLDALLAGETRARGLRLWTNSQCLVTTRRFAALPGFAAAAARSANRGWPVHVRASGGTTVVHRAGILNVSRCEDWDCGEGDISARFRSFCEGLASALAALGFAARLGNVARSYCDGRFNIVVGERKVAGTASLVRSTGGRVGLLAHASIWVSGDLDADIAAIANFEDMLGICGGYALTAHATLRQIAAPTGVDVLAWRGGERQSARDLASPRAAGAQ